MLQFQQTVLGSRCICLTEQRASSILFLLTSFFPPVKDWQTTKNADFFSFLSTECLFNSLLITLSLSPVSLSLCMCVCASGQLSSLSSQSDLYHPRLSGWGYLAGGPPLLKRRGVQLRSTTCPTDIFTSSLHFLL